MIRSRSNYLALAFLVGLAIVASASHAFAQAAAVPAANAVNIKPVLDFVVTLLAGLLTGLGSWSVTLFSGWLKLQKDSLVRKALTDGINTGINFAIQRAQVAAGQIGTVKIQNDIVRDATVFLVAHFPDAIKYFGLDSAAIERMILARLPVPIEPAVAAIAPAAAAPAVAPATA